MIEPSPTADATIPTFGGPTDVAIRAMWVADIPELASLRNGSGRVNMTIDSSGARLAVANLAPGASFAGTVEQIAGDQLRLVLDGDSGGCAAGAEGLYRWTQSVDGSLLTLTGLSDACVSRREALDRTWSRSLVGPTHRGAGIVDTMGTTFAVSLPDDTYKSRTLDDFIEIGSSTGLTLFVLKNPQGFVDACSTDEVRYPYTPGAAAFVAYFRQNDAFTVVEASPLTIDGHNAIHLVTKVKTDGARCPGTDLYAFTPKRATAISSAPTTASISSMWGPTRSCSWCRTSTSATALPVIDSIRIPYEVGRPSP